MNIEDLNEVIITFLTRELLNVFSLYYFNISYNLLIELI